MSLVTILNDAKNHNAQLVAVSKTQSQESILAFYEQGHRLFGENKVQELVEKQAALPKDIQWHFIGHLQRNKVKQIAPFVSMIHAVDSWRLLVEIDKQAAKNNSVIDLLLQVKIAQEDSKYGLSPNSCDELLKNQPWQELKHINICGLMGMATFTSDQAQVRSEFRLLKSCFDEYKSSHFPTDDTFCEISMGMSGDYLIALEEGSTLIRVGSLLFKS